MNRFSLLLVPALVLAASSSARAGVVKISASNYARHALSETSGCGYGRDWGLVIEVFFNDQSSKSIKECYPGPTTLRNAMRGHSAQLSTIAVATVEETTVGGKRVCTRPIGVMDDTNLNYLDEKVTCPVAKVALSGEKMKKMTAEKLRFALIESGTAPVIAKWINRDAVGYLYEGYTLMSTYLNFGGQDVGIAMIVTFHGKSLKESRWGATKKEQLEVVEFFQKQIRAL